MTRPEIIRADSIDLQDQNAPSAQEHNRIHPSPLGAGPPAPHQAETLREVAAEAEELKHRSPRVSREWTNGEAQQLQQYGDDDLASAVSNKLNGSKSQQQDDLAVAQNGGMTGSTEDAEMADAEGDDGMDDDMMDKISSSPSIDDGGYSLPAQWPLRTTSLASTPSPTKPGSFLQACIESSSPFVETSGLPLPPRPQIVAQGVVRRNSTKSNHHLLGKYPDHVSADTSFGDITQFEDPFISTDSPRDYDQEFSLEYYTKGHRERFSDTSAQDATETTNLFDELGEDLMGNEEREGENLEDESKDRPKLSHEEELTIPYEESEDDDYEIPYQTDSRFIDSGWGGECLQSVEDIDFEFVYALHTFVATVEGQANATKGDTMVLLDDSNSYWWLVRVVKDSSIGYLPAEHIETPTERLARLNKHRNIDLTSTMLGDQAEKSKNPLKKAIRRRNAKTVTFTAPTYVEASEIEYSTEEEDGESEMYVQNGQQEQNGESQESVADEDEIAVVEPLKTRPEVREVKPESEVTENYRPESTPNGTSDAARTSDELFEGKPESKSRNGTVRNTDSFFKDDTVETRKITLTPNLLRDDSSTSTRPSIDSKELKQRASLDKIEKDLSEKGKDKKDKKDKKEKEKKPGMLSGLFKRKDKKSKSVEDEVDEIMANKRSMDTQSPADDKESDDIVSIEEQAQAPPQEIQRNPSKLQKQPRPEASPSRKAGLGKEQRPGEPQQAPAPDRAPPVESVKAPSMRLVQTEPAEEPKQQSGNVAEPTRGATPILAGPKEQKAPSAISKILRTTGSTSSDTKPVKAKKAKSRIELDDFDSSEEDIVSPIEEPIRAPSKQQRPIPGAFPDSYIGTPANERSNPAEERLSESPVQVSPITPVQSYPPPLMVDTSSQEEVPSPQSSPSPELIEADDAQEKKAGSSTTSTSTPTWSDSHLRTFFEDDADIKDLLVVVYDKSGVVPAGPEHPVTGTMFREENAKLADITNRLDGMLGDWLARKMRAQGSSR